jgi:hypothetical protein
MTRIDAAHIDADDLQLLTLGEHDASAAERAHLAVCAACAGDYLALWQVVRLGRSTGFDRLLTPPAGVWAGIHTELGLGVALRSPPFSVPPRLRPIRAVINATDRPDSSVTPLDNLEFAPPAREQPVSGSTGNPKNAPARPLLRVLFAAAAGVIGLVGGIAIGVASTIGGSPREQVVAEAALDALPGWTARGSAQVEVAADGRRSVVVDLQAPPATSLHEVWLLNADASGLISIGFLDGSTGRFSIPASVDLDRYPLVDVSAESADGDPAHSGDSIVRGRLHGL